MIKFINRDNTYIDDTVIIGDNVTIYPNVYLFGETIIGDNVIIYPNTLIENSKIENGSIIYSSHIFDSLIGSNNIIGPYANIRKGTVSGEYCKIGSFTETKNSTFGNNSMIPHLSYIGDCTLGANVNVGCGVITANYDGYSKYRSNIEDNVFIGCNSVLVAPINIKKNSYVAAGSTVNEDVPENSLAIARTRQTNKINYKKN